MAGNALRKQMEYFGTVPEDQSGAFCRELTELSHKYGIGLTGEPVLFVMERDDNALTYEVDGESRVKIKST